MCSIKVEQEGKVPRKEDKMWRGGGFSFRSLSNRSWMIRYNSLTMKEALVGFCGFLQIRTMLITKIRAKMQMSTRLHGSRLDTAPKAWLRMMHSATTHPTAGARGTKSVKEFKNAKYNHHSASVNFSVLTREYSKDGDSSRGGWVGRWWRL